MPAAVDERAVAVLFDFDGTLGDTETPAMRVAFWELAPYFPDATAESLTVAARDDFVRANAGKAFEFMVDVVEEDRAKAGMPPSKIVRSGASEQSDVLSVVDAKARFESASPWRRPGSWARTLTLQRRDRGCARGPRRALPRRAADLASLRAANTAVFHRHHQRKPRVPVRWWRATRACIPPEAIHSGESDFDPPRFKPDPSVYLLAAEDRRAPKSVRRGGGQHAGRGERFQRENRTHRRLRRRVARRARREGRARFDVNVGVRAEDGRGADIVISEFTDLLPLVKHFEETDAKTPSAFPKNLLDGLKAKYYLP